MGISYTRDSATSLHADLTDTDTDGHPVAAISGLQEAIDAAVAALVAGAPGALNTLDELAAALGDDANFATSVTTALAGKQAAATAMVVVAYAGSAGAARPSGAAAVYWKDFPTEPTNMADGDFWWEP